MADGSKIEWTDATWNPVTGCSVVSPGCTNCYAMRLAGTRMRGHASRLGLTVETKAGPVWNGLVRFNEAWLDQPLRWKRPRRVFVCAHGDLFHEGVPNAWLDRVFAVMALAPQHSFQVLTKRAARMRAYIDGLTRQEWWKARLGEASGAEMRRGDGTFPTWPLSNVWLGVSAEDQQRADERVPDLLATPSAVRFASAEPLLGPIDFTKLQTFGGGQLDALRGMWATYPIVERDGRAALLTKALARLDQIIVGGESGPGSRPMHQQWAGSIRDQCASAAAAFFFKQWGEWLPVTLYDIDGGPEVFEADDGRPEGAFAGVHVATRALAGQWFACVGKARAGRLLDGRIHDAMPGVAA